MVQLALQISSSDLDKLHVHAEQCLPLESVALLFGTHVETTVDVMRIELMANKAKSTTTFEVDPEVEYRLLVEAESKGQDLIGIFHSHPAPPQPSSSDKRNMKLNPVVWLIASKATGRWESRAYIMKDDEVVEINISLT